VQSTTGWLTPAKKQLVAEQSKWERMLKAIRLVMRPTEE
jgi:hypothetical protein